MMHDPLTAKVLQELDRHQQRRDGGIPTLSVLVGPPGLAVTLWRDWTLTSGRALLLVRAGGRSPAQAVAGEWVVQPWIIDRLIDYLSPDLNISSDRVRYILSGAPCQERSNVVNAMVSVSYSGSMETLCRSLLSIPRDGASDAPDDLRENQLIQALACVEGSRAPGILFVDDDTSERTARSLADLIDRCPGVPLGWTVSERIFSASVVPMPSSRAKTICREGVVLMEQFSADTIRQKLFYRAGMGIDHLSEATCRRLADDGVSDLVLDRFAEAIAASARSRDGLELPEKARSAAEAFLFQRLESLPETAGLFELNGELTADWGLSGKVEVDLLCRNRKLAVEVDGYFHFSDPDRYRKDRQKDVLLQQQGFLVLRFLADDVVAKLETILDTILTSLHWREVQGAKRERQHE